MGAVPVTLRAVKGSALTHDEMDANFSGLSSGSIYVGMTVLWFAATPPDATWLELGGQSVLVADYPDLFSRWGYSFGGSGLNMLLPNTQGVFVRGWNHGGTGDPDAASRTDRGDGTVGDNIGTRQLDQLQDHEHVSEAIQTGSQGSGVRIQSSTAFGTTAARILAPTTGNHGLETRPINIYGMWIVKAKY